MFLRRDLLEQARLAPRHRGRVVVLESDVVDPGEVTRVMFGIVRHPKAHPLAPRGEEVLEIIEYDVAAQVLKVVGGRNLTRNPV